MKSVLSKISEPLLIGSILALGALAYPGHADAEEPLVVFRLKSQTLTAPTQVADNGGGQDSGGEDGPGPKSWLVLSYVGGYSIECRTAWTADFVAGHPKAFRSGSLSLAYPYADAWSGWFNFASIPDGRGEWYRTLAITPASGGGASGDLWLAKYGQPCVAGTASLVGPPPPSGLDHRFIKIAIEQR